MLYTKRFENELTNEDFMSPEKSYFGCPFWAWNCKLSKELISQQIEAFEKMGVGGVMIHARTGLDTEYLGDEFMDHVIFAKDECKKRGMLCWLYDEDRFPSGAAGGIVTKDPSFRARYLRITKKRHEEFEDSYEAYKDRLKSGEIPSGYYLTSYKIVFENGCLIKYEQVGTKEEKREDSEEDTHSIYHVYVELMKEDPWFNGQSYLDVLNQSAVERFLEVTYERYADVLGDEFGKTIPAIFTDEPHMKGNFTLSAPDSEQEATLPFTDGILDSFAAEYGYDFLSVLPELLWELPGENLSVHRYRYRNHLTERFAKSYGDTIGAWCEKHNIMFTGHFLSERTLYSQTLALGESMRQYRSFQLPGIDILADQKELSTAKQAVSVARQYGREGVASELYGVTHWDHDFKGHKLQGDWQAALGVTARVHHLGYMSMEGEAKRDWPAAISYQSPWYDRYPYIENHFGRVNTALTKGKALVRVGVLCPIESFWMKFGPNSQTQTARDQMDENYENLMRWMLYGTIDFDLISEALLPAQAKEISAPLQVGQMSYEVIVLPAMLTVRRSTIQILNKFLKKGGKVLIAGEMPVFVDGVSIAEKLSKEQLPTGHLPKGQFPKKQLPEEVLRPEATGEVLTLSNTPIAETDSEDPVAGSRAEWMEFVSKAETIAYNKERLLAKLEEYRDLDVREAASGKRSANLFYQIREEGENRFVFLCHVNKKINKVDQAEKYVLSIKGSWNVEILHTMTGEVEPVAAEYKNSSGAGSIQTCLFWTAYAEDSLLLRLRQRTEEEQTGAFPARQYLESLSMKKEKSLQVNNTLAETITFHQADQYIGNEPNVLLLDRCEYRFDDQPWQQKEDILQADNKIRKSLGLPMRQDAAVQPWCIKEEKKVHTVHLRYEIQSEIDVHFASLAMERPQEAAILLNGTAIEPTITGWFVDRFIHTIALPVIPAGKSILELIIPFGQRTNLEALYLLGDFGTECTGNQAVITEKPKTLDFADITRQRHPFYVGNMTYCITITAEEDWEEAILEIPQFASPVLEVQIDEKEKTDWNDCLIAFAPHKLSLGQLPKGVHKISITAYGNRFNSFGTLHNCDTEFMWYGPDSYRTKGSQWTDTYCIRPFGILSPIHIHRMKKQ